MVDISDFNPDKMQIVFLGDFILDGMDYGHGLALDNNYLQLL